MNSFETLEIYGVVIIICLQIYFFLTTRSKIELFRSVFPMEDAYEIIKPGLLKSHFELHPREVFSNLEKYTLDSIPKMIETEIISAEGILLRPSKFEDDQRVFIDLISIKTGGNRITSKLLYAINTYLFRNRGVASDFHLIKDVVERNCDAVENDINQSISLPLYLGLLGTFLGIILGLIQISGVDFSNSSEALDDAIKLLLGGVKIAMFASFTGLLLTIINSGFIFKGAKESMEDKKNDFYTFLQIDLLPLLNQNINSTLFSLQSNLHKFNQEFKGNITVLSAVMGKNYDALVAQEKILSTLEKMDVMEFAKANVKVLRELQIATDKFAEFNMYLGAVNELVTNTKAFSNNLTEVLTRTDTFHHLGQQLVTIFSENKELIKFLQNHYNSLDASHQLIVQSVNGVGNTLDESLLKLKEFTQERIIEVQKITLKEIELMQQQYPEKWKKLDNLSRLESVDKNLIDIKISTAAQLGSMTNEIKSFNEKLGLVINELETIRNTRRNSLGEKVTGTLKRIFKKKKLL